MPVSQTIQPRQISAYWVCQFGGWFIFFLIEFLFAFSLHPPQLRPSIVAAEWGLSAFDGLVATHLLYLFMRQHRWFDYSGSKLLLRFTCVVPFIAIFLNSIDWGFARFVQIRCGLVFSMSLPMVFITWTNWMIVLTSWVALYFGLHEFRMRQIREVRGLRIEVAAQQAQLRGLRAQLDSHFLFNCLNGLREIIGEDSGQAQVIVERLSGLLRYSLQPYPADLVSLEVEILRVKDYLALESMRFEERLQVSWQVAPETYPLKLPPMLLQSLVENAVKHGIARRPQGGSITITVRVDGSHMVVEITNSGTISEKDFGSGLGLRNAKERLHLLYGECASLDLARFGEDQVRATVRIPCISEESDA